MGLGGGSGGAAVVVILLPLPLLEDFVTGRAGIVGPGFGRGGNVGAVAAAVLLEVAVGVVVVSLSLSITTTGVISGSKTVLVSLPSSTGGTGGSSSIASSTVVGEIF